MVPSPLIISAVSVHKRIIRVSRLMIGCRALNTVRIIPLTKIKDPIFPFALYHIRTHAQSIFYVYNSIVLVSMAKGHSAETTAVAI